MPGTRTKTSTRSHNEAGLSARFAPAGVLGGLAPPSSLRFA